MRHYPTQQRAILRSINEAEAAMLPLDWRQDLPPDVFSAQHPAPAGRKLADCIMLPLVALGWLAMGGPLR
jgi:hypothetical protein